MAPGGHKPSKSNARVDNRFPADSFATPANQQRWEKWGC